MSHVYDGELFQTLTNSAKAITSPINLVTGTYVGVSGPMYESPAEIHMLRTIGADAVGMSTVFEVVTAGHCGIKVLGLSLITNRCRGPKDTAPAPSHEEVLRAVDSSQTAIQNLVSRFVADVDLKALPNTQGYTHFSTLSSSSSSDSSSSHCTGEENSSCRSKCLVTRLAVGVGLVLGVLYLLKRRS